MPRWSSSCCEIIERAFEGMQEIVGGFDLLPKAFFERLPHDVRLGAQVEAVEQDEDGVTVRYRTQAPFQRIRRLLHMPAAVQRVSSSRLCARPTRPRPGAKREPGRGVVADS